MLWEIFRVSKNGRGLPRLRHENCIIDRFLPSLHQDNIMEVLIETLRISILYHFNVNMHI